MREPFRLKDCNYFSFVNLNSIIDEDGIQQLFSMNIQK
jgi:hypothetical protein